MNEKNFKLSQTWKEYEFWCEGVLFSCLGVFGLLSNLVTLIAILSSPAMMQHTFNHLLAALSFIVILLVLIWRKVHDATKKASWIESHNPLLFLSRYIIFNVPVHARTIPEVSSWFSDSSFLSQVLTKTDKGSIFNLTQDEFLRTFQGSRFRLQLFFAYR